MLFCNGFNKGNEFTSGVDVFSVYLSKNYLINAIVVKNSFLKVNILERKVCVYPSRVNQLNKIYKWKKHDEVLEIFSAIGIGIKVEE